MNEPQDKHWSSLLRGGDTKPTTSKETTMDTLEDLERFVQEMIAEHEAAQAEVSMDDSEYDYYEGLLDAYTLVSAKINKILSK